MTNQSTHGVRMRGVARTRARAPGCGGGGRGAPERAAPQAGLTGLRWPVHSGGRLTRQLSPHTHKACGIKQEGPRPRARPRVRSLDKLILSFERDG